MPETKGKQEVPLGSLRDIPNAITAARLVVSLLCFVALSLGWYRAAVVLFALAAGTDWADGYWARRWGPITRLGRVLDPMADKLLICGVFTYLVAIPESRVAPWMAIVVLGRELLVTTLRSMVESTGGDFSAVIIGKWKFVLQVVCAGVILVDVSPWQTLAWPTPGQGPSDVLVSGLLWAMLGITILSGVTYTRSAIVAMRED